MVAWAVGAGSAVRPCVAPRHAGGYRREMRPSHRRPDMPLCHAKDLRVPKTFREAQDGEHGVQFMDAAKREVFGLLEAGAFEIADE